MTRTGISNFKLNIADFTFHISHRRLKSARICYPISLIIVVCLLLAACGRPVQVPERVRPLPGNPAGEAVESDLTVKAVALVNQDEVWQSFKANLILARVLVVDLTVANAGRRPVQINKARFRLSDSQGQEFSWLKPKDVEDRIYSYYGIRYYVTATRKEIEEAFERQALNIRREVKPGDVREGLVYFEIPEAEQFNRFDPLTLSIEKVRLSETEKTIQLVLKD